MSSSDEPTQSLLRAGSQQTDIEAEAPGQRPRSSRAYKVAGLAVLACALIAGQAAIAYFLLSEKSDIKSLQEQTNKMRMELTKARSVQVPMRMQMPVSSLTEYLDEDLTGGTRPKKALGTNCQKAASGLTPLQVPGFRPACDQFGLYQPQQCFAGECWCVKPATGEQIPGSVRRGPANCRSAGAMPASVLELPVID